MPTNRRVAWLRACLITALPAVYIACGSSSGGSAGNGGPGDDGGSADATGDTGGGSEAGRDGGAGGDTGGGPSDAATDSNPGVDAGGEPAYLRNDAIAGFAFTADYGSPYDSILGAPLNTTQSAIAPGAKTVTAPGQIVASERYQLVANSSDLYSALDISASLSVSTGLASVNAKTDFAKTTQIDTTDLTVLVDLSQVGTAQKIVNPTLTAQAAALGPDAFYSLYGDRYAAEIVTGAEMFCTVSIATYSQQDKTSLTAMLGFSYGASSGSASFASTVMSSVGSRHVNVNCQYLGYSPTTLVTNLQQLQDAANAFQQGAVATLGNVTTSALYFLYTSYYGIPGYMGVPAGTAAKVAQQGQIASDYLLYDSLVNNDFSAYYGDPSYSSLPFFAHMKAYRDGLSQYLVALNMDSQNPGVPVPTAQADGLISNWVTAKSAASQPNATPQFEAYVLGNGIVPKKLGDYAIPLKYAYADAAGNGTLNGTTFAPVSSVPSVSNLASTNPVDYPLYLVNKAGTGGGLWLEYQWDAGTYFFSNVTDSNGNPDPTAINSAILNFGLTGDLAARYIVVNKANGMVVTDNGGSNGITATHLVNTTGATSSSQLWGFYLDNGSGNCTTYVAQAADAGAPGVNCTVNGNYPGTQCGSGMYAVSKLKLDQQVSGYWEVSNTGMGSAIDTIGGGGCQHCDSSCPTNNWCQYTSCGGGPVPWDLFFLVPYNSGTTQAIYNYAGTGGGAVSWVVMDSSTSAVVVGPHQGNANELWVFIPASNVDTTP